MRGLALALLLLAVPLSGCVANLGDSPRLTLFALAPIQRGDPTPVPARDCDELLETLGSRALTQARVALEQSVEGRGYYGHGDVVMASFESSDAQMTATSPPAMASGGAGGSAKHAQVTGTNNQEAEADEADILKTDGEWTYVLAGNKLRILHSDRVGDVAEFATMSLGESYGGQLLLEPREPGNDRDDRLVVIVPTYSHPEQSGVRLDKTTASMVVASAFTRILVLSLADRAKPALLQETWVEGHPAGARLIDGHAYVVVQTWEETLPLRTWAHPDEEDLLRRGLTWDEYYLMTPENQTELRRAIALEVDAANLRALADVELEDHLPTVLEATPLPSPLRGSVAVRPEITDDACRRVLSTPESTGRAVSTILALSVGASRIESSTLQVVAGSSIVYASGESLVLAASSQDFWWFYAQPELEEATDLHWFDLDGLDVKLRASGRVPGIVQDSFGIDVQDDALRVATTTGTWGRWWLDEPEPMLNHVAVLREVAGQLVPTGMVGGIAPGERIWSARFTEDRAYLVTFRNVDPLWVIDLSGAVPEILGELEIPGVSTYIHPLDDDTLLTIGYGPGEGGVDLDWGNIQVSLFDISDPSRPRRADVLDVSPPNGYTWSGAVQEHKAFTYWGAIGKLAIPVSTGREVRILTAEGESYRHDVHVGLKLIDVDRERLDLSVHGEVSQDHLVGPDAWHAEVERSYFLGYPERGEVSVYAMSQLGMTAHDLATLQMQDSVAFH